MDVTKLACHLRDSEYSHHMSSSIRSRATFAAILMFVALANVNTSASANDCPDSWRIERPNLVITSSPITRIDEQRGTESSSYTSSLPPNIQGMTGDVFASKDFPLFRGQMVVEKLRQLGSNADISATYIASTKSPFQNLEKGNGKQVYGDWAELFGPPEQAWKLRWMGLGNGSSLIYRVSIFVKGCEEFVIDSTSYTFKDLPEDVFDVDPFYQLFETRASFNRRLTSKQIIVSKKNLSKNVAAIAGASEGVAIPLERIDPEVESVIGFLFVGLKPGGCLNVNDGGRSIPPWNAPYAEILSAPCKVGVYSMYPDKGLAGVTLVTSFDVVSRSRTETREKEESATNSKEDLEAKAKARAEALAAAKAKAEAEVDPEALAAAKARAKAKAEAKEAKAEAAKQRVTIFCIKGKITKKVTATNPKCPVGYVRKQA